MAGTLIGGVNPWKEGSSRYAPVGGAIPPADKNETGSSSGASTGASTGTSTSSGTSQSNTNQTQTSNQTTKNMDPASLAALNQLIQALMGGGTADMKKQRAVRDNERQTVGNMREGYSKGAAFTDAQGLIAQQMRRALEQMLPSISRAAEDAGSSGGALRALLMQDAADKASESSSALGVKTAVDYGNISSNLSQVLERLTTPDNSVTQALIGALGVAKGATVNTTGTVNTVGSTTGSENKTITENKSNVNTEDKTQQASTDYAPFRVVSQAGSGQLVYPENEQAGPKYPVGSTADFLEQLYGGNNAWSGYKF